MVFLTLAHTQALRGHVTLPLLFDRLPHGVQRMLAVITSFLGMFLTVVLTWAAAGYSLDSRRSGEITDLLHLPLYPFKFLLVVGALALFCQFILDLRISWRQIGSHRRGNGT